MPIPIRLSLVLLLALLVGPASGVDSELRSFRSARYTVLTDMQGPGLEELVDHMDKVCAEYLRRFKSFHVRNPGPLNLYLFKDQDSYLRHLATMRINGTGSAGMFFVRGDERGLAAWVGERDIESVKGTLRHEGLHQIAHQRIHQNLPQWVNEGLAEYFQYSMVTSRGLETGLADPAALARIQAAVRRDTHIPLYELLYVTNRDWNDRVRSGEGASLQYDQAWSVVHFLVHAKRGQYEDLLIRFLRECSTGKSAQQATEAVFSRDLATMERAWSAYILELRPDPLVIARAQLGVWENVLRAYDRVGIRPTNGREIEELLSSSPPEQSLVWVPRELGPSFGEDEDWWRTPPTPIKSGRTATLRFVPDRRQQLPPRVEIVGLRRTLSLVWTRENDELSAAIEIR